MRKLVLIAICVLATTSVVAQSHTFGDTIYERYQQFDFDAWVMEDTLHHGKVYDDKPLYPRSQSALGYDDILQYNYTDNTAGMRVVGLSAAIALSQIGMSPNVSPEYLLLYEATPDTFELKAMVQWQESDSAGRPYFEFMYNVAINCDSTCYGLGYATRHNYPRANFFRIFEYYFDKPIVVYDSFYVGGTDYSNRGIFTHSHATSYSNYITFRPSQIYRTDTCYNIALWKIYHHGNHGFLTPAFQWNWIPSNQFLMILPIIEVVDTSFANAPVCPEVSDLFVHGNYTDTVTLQWASDSLHQEFELSYGRDGTPPDEGTIVTLNNTTRWQFTDITYSDTPMVSYVRTVCREYDTLRWSGWSSPLRWKLHHEYEPDTTQHEGIAVPDDRNNLSRYVQLMPNPASGSVLVSSSYGIDRVEAYDVRGEKVMDQPTEGRTAVIDVTAWPKGAYVVLVRTPAGTAAKRLVVQ